MKDEQRNPEEHGRRNAMWCLTEDTVQSGYIKPTTQFRKKPANKRRGNSAVKPSPRRAASGAKGGRATRDSARPRRRGTARAARKETAPYHAPQVRRRESHGDMPLLIAADNGPASQRNLESSFPECDMGLVAAYCNSPMLPQDCVSFLSTPSMSNSPYSPTDFSISSPPPQFASAPVFLPVLAPDLRPGFQLLSPPPPSPQASESLLWSAHSPSSLPTPPYGPAYWSAHLPPLLEEIDPTFYHATPTPSTPIPHFLVLPPPPLRHRTKPLPLADSPPALAPLQLAPSLPPLMLSPPPPEPLRNDGSLSPSLQQRQQRPCRLSADPDVPSAVMRLCEDEVGLFGGEVAPDAMGEWADALTAAAGGSGDCDGVECD